MIGTRIRLLLVLAPALLAGCEALLSDPAPTVGTATLSFAVGDYDPDGLLPLMAAAEDVALTFTANGVSRDTLVPLEPVESSTYARVTLHPSERVALLTIAAELRAGGGGTFAGAVEIDAAGRISTTATVAVAPIVDRLAIRSDVDRLEALGDTATLEGVAIMVTGDTIPGATFTWLSADPSIVEVTGGDRAVARSNGVASVVASHGPLQAALPLTVRQRMVTLTGLAPADTTVVEGAVFELRPFGTDPNGYPLLPGSAGAEWSATGPLSVSTEGVVRAFGIGSGTVSARLGGGPTYQTTVTVTAN